MKMFMYKLENVESTQMLLQVAAILFFALHCSLN